MSAVIHLEISDHSLVYALKYQFPNKTPNLSKKRSFKYYNKERFNMDLFAALNGQDWQFDDPNRSWEIFKGIFILVSEMHAPQLELEK